MKKQNLKIILSILINVFFCATLIAQTKTFFSTENGLSNSLINQIYQDKKGYIWIATEYGLNKFDGINFTTYKHIEGDSTSLRHNYIRTVFQSSAGVFYIGTMEGLMEYDSATDSFQNIELIRDNKTVYPHISSIIETKNGDVWLSTSGQGVFYSKKGSKKFIYQSKLTLELNSIYLNFIFEDSQSRIWIGSESDGLNMYDPKTRAIKSFKAPHAINSNNISAISEDSQGNIYVGTLTKGLSKLDTTEQKFHSIKHHSNPQLFIKSIQIDDKDRLYIGTDGQGLMLYNSVDNVIEDYKLNSVPFDLTKGKVHSILFDKDKNIWLGFFQKGLFLIP
ncbi:MAG: hybrid sensor histidine kinase/response regulator, partial [Bacteroidales bacterium]|nr:hybrid sensor histidine kinase/response regulator [Bacteroidales bacterium]